MRKYLFSLLSGVLLMAASSAYSLNIFACSPEWGALAQEIGGEKVQVKTATTARQDVHHIQAKPSLIAAMRNADMVFCTGGGLEEGWLPILLTQVGKHQLQPGGEASLMASDHVKMLEVPQILDRSQGHIHAGGNPHIHTSPHNIAIVAAVFAAKIAVLDSANAAYYNSRYQNFSARWQTAIKKWEQGSVRLKGAKIAVQHGNWIYLTNWLGLDVVTSLEPKPGVSPSTGHLAEVLAILRQKPVKVVIYAAYENSSPSEWLSEKAGIKSVRLPFTVGGNEESGDLFSLFDSTIELLNNNIR